MLVSALSPVIGYDKHCRPSTTPTAADALCGKLPWTPARSAPKTSTESSTRPTWLVRSSRSALVEQRNRMSTQTPAVAERPGVVEFGAHGGAGAGWAGHQTRA